VHPEGEPMDQFCLLHAFSHADNPLLRHTYGVLGTLDGPENCL
jgi:hypothetical protein